MSQICSHTLCKSCEAFLRQERRSENDILHDSLSGFQAAVSLGCRICTDLWALFDRDRDIDSSLNLDFNDMTFGVRWRTFLKSSSRPYVQLSISYGGICHHYTLEFSDYLERTVAGRSVNHESSSGSAKSLELAKTWIDHCSEDHQACKPSQKSKFRRPTRLVYVGSRSSPLLRLSIRTESAVHGPYTTLSHCWGSGVTLRLLRNTLEGMKKFITAESLPKTFQEAIIVTRALGVEYIWIDSLCIIQDDIQDWRYESSQMCDVYNNSYCNIAATHSTNSAGGLFVDRDPSSISCLLIKPEWTGMENRQFMAVLSAVNSIWYSKVEVAPLNQRGWVVQERILAPRTLHFAYNQIMWQCPDMAASETFPSGFANFFPAAFLPANMLSFHDLNRNSLTFWESLIIKYYRCQLTKGNDKLVAIAGIARRLALSTGESYMAGLWRNTLDSKFLSQLLWYAPEFSPPAPRTERPTSYRAPSWSWASIDGIITFCDVTKSKGWERSTPLLQVLQCEVHLAGVDPFGDLTGGYIRISCCLHPITARYERDKWKLLSSDNDEANLISSHEIANSLYFDETKLRAPHGIKEDVKLFLLPILQNQRSVGCIMLSLTGKRQGEYTRVGFFQAEGECANFLADGKRTYKDRSQLYEKQTIRTITIL